MSEVQKLLARLETEEPSRELADEVLLATSWKKRIARLVENNVPLDVWQWQSPDGKIFYAERPDPLQSLDAAVQLLPDGSLWCVGSMEDGPFARVIAPNSNGDYLGQSDNTSHGKTPAQALTIACMKAGLHD